MKGEKILSDEEILIGLRSNDLNKPLLQIYQQYAEAIAIFVTAHGGSDQDGDDVFQESVVAFVDLVQKGKFREQSSIKTLLISIARNIWYNQMKKSHSLDSRARKFEAGRDHTEENITLDLDAREIKQEFLEVMAKMGESCRTILTLFYYENYSFKEIASRMAYENEQVARNKKYKCMKELTDLIRDNPLLSDNQ